MALSTIDEVRRRLLHETPVQWCSELDLVDRRLAETKFSTLAEFVTTKFSQGGLGITLQQACQFLDFNPAYEHLAKKLKAKLGIAELAKATPAIKAHGGVREQDAIPEKGNLPKLGSNASKYRIAKLKRDYPAVALRLEAGEFKTVREAERAAGILPSLKPRSRLTLPLDDVKLARRLFAEWLECNYGVKK